MNNKFDELAKGLAQTTTRRQALKTLGAGLAGMALACFAVTNSANAGTRRCKNSGSHCDHGSQCCSGGCYKTYRGGYCA
jgi:hypothetical protein